MTKNDDKLIIAMPAGSLANPKRGGNLISLLEASGFKTSGYESGGPSSFSTVNFFYGWDGRPQEFGSQLCLGEIDVAIAGDDWIRERVYEAELEFNQQIELEQVLSLKRGNVRIVGIADTEGKEISAEDFLRKLCAEKKLITLVTEMPYLGLYWIRDCLKKLGLADQYKDYSVQKYKTPSRIESGILVYETWGKTEAKVKNGGADLGVEITQSGSALRNYSLNIIDEIMKSQTSIWVSPAIKKNQNKTRLLKLFLLNLYGTINAENKVLLLFNAPNKDGEKIMQYLENNSLFANEPTVSRGEHFSQYSIQVESDNQEKPLALLRFELAEMGARSIDTLPLQSSIPDINAVSF